MEKRLNSYLPCKQYPWLEGINNTVLLNGKNPDISLIDFFHWQAYRNHEEHGKYVPNHYNKG